jgi:hypothetical protein
MSAHYICDVRHYLRVNQYIACVFSCEEGDRNAPGGVLRDAPVIEIVHFFHYIEVVRVEILEV